MLPLCCSTSHTHATCSWVKPKEGSIDGDGLCAPACTDPAPIIPGICNNNNNNINNNINKWAADSGPHSRPPITNRRPCHRFVDPTPLAHYRRHLFKFIGNIQVEGNQVDLFTSWWHLSETINGKITWKIDQGRVIRLVDPLADKKVIGHLFGRIQDKHLCLLPSLSALSFWSVQPPMQTSNQLLNSLTWPSHSNFSLHNGLGHFVRNSTNNTEMWPKMFSKRFIFRIFFFFLVEKDGNLRQSAYHSGHHSAQNSSRSHRCQAGHVRRQVGHVWWAHNHLPIPHEILTIFCHFLPQKTNSSIFFFQWNSLESFQKFLKKLKFRPECRRRCFSHRNMDHHEITRFNPIVAFLWFITYTLTHTQHTPYTPETIWTKKKKFGMKYFLRWIVSFVPINKKQVLRFPESTNHCEVRLSRDLLTPPRACVNQGDAVGNTVTAALAHHSLNASRCIFQWNGGGAWSPWTPPPASSHWPVLRLSVPPVATPSGHGRSIFFRRPNSFFVFSCFVWSVFGDWIRFDFWVLMTTKGAADAFTRITWSSVDKFEDCLLRLLAAFGLLFVCFSLILLN